MHVCKQVYTSKIANTVTSKEEKETKDGLYYVIIAEAAPEWPRGDRERPANPFSPKIKAQKTAKDSETPRAVGLFSTAPNAAAAKGSFV